MEGSPKKQMGRTRESMRNARDLRLVTTRKKGRKGAGGEEGVRLTNTRSVDRVGGSQETGERDRCDANFPVLFKFPATPDFMV